MKIYDGSSVRWLASTCKRTLQGTNCHRHDMSNTSYGVDIMCPAALKTILEASVVAGRQINRAIIQDWELTIYRTSHKT